MTTTGYSPLLNEKDLKEIKSLSGCLVENSGVSVEILNTGTLMLSDGVFTFYIKDMVFGDDESQNIVYINFEEYLSKQSDRNHRLEAEGLETFKVDKIYTVDNLVGKSVRIESVSIFGLIYHENKSPRTFIVHDGDIKIFTGHKVKDLRWLCISTCDDILKKVFPKVFEKLTSMKVGK